MSQLHQNLVGLVLRLWPPKPEPSDLPRQRAPVVVSLRPGRVRQHRNLEAQEAHDAAERRGEACWVCEQRKGKA